MAQSHGKGMEKFAAFNLTPADLAAEAKRRIEEFADAQTKQLDKLQETNGCGSTACRQRRILLRNLPRSWPQPVRSLRQCLRVRIGVNGGWR
jgi:hypothetical protein